MTLLERRAVCDVICVREKWSAIVAFAKEEFAKGTWLPIIVVTTDSCVTMAGLLGAMKRKKALVVRSVTKDIRREYGKMKWRMNAFEKP